jgi:PPOX class probable F420-dependent enzyme
MAMGSNGIDGVGGGVGRTLRAGELAFLREARVGRLATVDARQRPVVVPVCFAVIDGDAPAIVSVLDEKPKRVADEELGRVRNISQNPQVCLVVDRYDEDWSRLAFVQVHGRARVIVPGDDGHVEAVELLRAKYPQYVRMAIEQRPVIVIEGLTGFSWRGDGTRFG